MFYLLLWSCKCQSLYSWLSSVFLSLLELFLILIFLQRSSFEPKWNFKARAITCTFTWHNVEGKHCTNFITKALFWSNISIVSQLSGVCCEGDQASWQSSCGLNAMLDHTGTFSSQAINLRSWISNLRGWKFFWWSRKVENWFSLMLCKDWQE